MSKVRRVKFDHKRAARASTARPKSKPAKTETTATASAAASARPDGRAGTAKQKGAKQKDFREPPNVERKELVTQTPKPEGLLSVAKQAIERLREKKDTTTKVSKGEAPDTNEPPAKRQLMAKGQSMIVGKGKSTVPATTVSTTSTVMKTESSAVFETPKTECVEMQPRVAPRLPNCEKRAMSQVDVDLIISTEAPETETENYADVFVAGKEEVYSDIEPCSPERVTV